MLIWFIDVHYVELNLDGVLIVTMELDTYLALKHQLKH